MPPQVSQITSSVQFSSTVASESPKFGRAARNMKLPGKKLLPVLVFILACLSILRLFKIAIGTTHSSSLAAAFLSSVEQECSSPSECSEVPPNAPWGLLARSHKTSRNATLLALKEFMLLSNLINRKAPCNLLVFGLQSQYLNLSSINAGGITVFLHDDGPYKIPQPNGTRIYKVRYKVPAKKAYELLKHARGNPDCTPRTSLLQQSTSPRTSLLQQSTCKLALKSLPQEVYQIKWDVVVVDGPIGDAPEAPGRMSSIYTASMLARAGKTTHVVVHDVHRTIEKWFSWEFLCEENLVASKGKLWNFRISDHSNSSRFCSSQTVRVE